jgi:hypothetical protein
MKLTENNLVGAVKELFGKGYTDDFRIKKNVLVASQAGIELQPKDFTVDAAYKFEGAESEADTQYLFAISSSNGAVKGLLIDALDIYQDLDETAITEKLNVHFDTYVFDDNKAEQKYGLPKVFKTKFDVNPHRYELRIGYPDFPPCPFGNSFSMLGFDKDNNQYVWLVTSIIKDGRLNKVEIKK